MAVFKWEHKVMEPTLPLLAQAPRVVNILSTLFGDWALTAWS
jgi:hypothetical protein